jgi:lauroyl/myristoyl acyltransferase
LNRPMEDLCVRAIARVLDGEEDSGSRNPLSPERKWRATITTFIRQMGINLLLALPYDFVDGVVRWLSRNTLIHKALYRQEALNLNRVLRDIGYDGLTSAGFSDWVYANLLYFWRIAALNRREEFLRRVRVQGLEHLNNARQTGHGVILLGSNVGLKHLTVVLMNLSNIDDVMLIGGGMRTLELVGLSQLKSQFLLDIDHDMIKSNSHLSYQLARGKSILEQGGILTLAGDGHRGMIRQELPFLARTHPFGTGFANLAIATDAVAEIQFHPPIAIPDGDKNEQIRVMVEQFAHRLESYWRVNIQNVHTRQIKQYLA